jgi:hypothetical protein
MNPMSFPIIGFGSRARVGKDHACKLIETHYEEAYRIAFADALKSDLHNRLNPPGVNVYTEDPVHKAKIRSLLVGYGMTMRAVDPDYWIRRAYKQMEDLSRYDLNSDLVVFTDVRFPNEVRAIKSWGGFYVEIATEERPFVNEEEALNSPPCAELADFTVHNRFDPQYPDIPDPDFEKQILVVVKAVLTAHELTRPTIHATP